MCKYMYIYIYNRRANGIYIYPKKLQFAAYGQFVLVFHRKGKPDVSPVDKHYFTWTTKAIRCHVIN